MTQNHSSQFDSSLLPLRIVNRSDLDLCLDVLRLVDPALCMVMDALGEIPLRLQKPGYEGMAKIIVGQMVSKASANAIFSRLQDLLPEITAPAVLAVGDDALLSVGLSGAKQRTLSNLALAEMDGDIDFDHLYDISAEDALKNMVALKGIGPWTAQVYLMFCAGHVDVFPDGDIALQQAMVDIGLVSERPTAKAASHIAEKWRPVRAAAARVLWAEYARQRSRVDLPV